MASSVEDAMKADDLVEQAREMDGNILRKETFTSSSLSTRLVLLYDDSGCLVRSWTEDV